MTSLAVIGDVHGDVDRLQRMLRRLGPLERTTVFVGDYVNGEPHGAAVIEELVSISVAEPSRYHFLAGNHEFALLRYLDDGDFVAFAAQGGVSTVHSYVDHVNGNVHDAFTAAFPNTHRRFLETLKTSWSNGETFIAHSGFDAARPDARDVEALVMGRGTPPFDATKWPARTVVCGHYIQANGKPYVSDHLICIDTGCGRPGGCLTAVLLPERDFISF